MDQLTYIKRKWAAINRLAELAKEATEARDMLRVQQLINASEKISKQTCIQYIYLMKLQRRTDETFQNAY